MGFWKETTWLCVLSQLNHGLYAQPLWLSQAEQYADNLTLFLFEELHEKYVGLASLSAFAICTDQMKFLGCLTKQIINLPSL